MGILSGYSAASGGMRGSAPGRDPTTLQRALRAGINPLLSEEEVREREGKTVGGFVENVFGDLREIGTGLTSLISAAGSDLWDVTKEVATLGDADTDGYNLAEIARRLPEALGEDYSRRYGGQGGDAVLDALYEDPLSYVGDALAALTAGGYAAARGAQAASRLPSVNRGLSAIADGGDAGIVASTVDKILPGLKEGTGAWSAGTRQVVNPLTQRVETIPRHFNPARRVFSEQVTQRMLSRPTERLQREVAVLEAEVMKEGGPELAPRALVNDFALKQNALRLAEAANNARILRPAVAGYQVKRITDRLIGGHGGAHVVERDRMAKEFGVILSRLSKDEANEFFSRAQVHPPADSPGRLDFETIRTMAPETNREVELLETIQDDLARIAAMEAGQAPEGLIRRARVDVEEVAKKTNPDLSPKQVKVLAETLLPGRIAELLPYEIEMAKRYVQWLSEGAVADRVGYVDNFAQVMDDTRLAVHRNLTNPYLESGGTYRTVFERALKPMNKAINDKWDFDAPEHSLAMDDTLRADGFKAPLYVPHIETLNLKVSDFLIPWRMSGMRKNAESGRKGYKRSEGAVFERWLEGVKDAAVTNPLDAYARRAAEIARHKEAIYFLEHLVDEVGRPIEAMDDLAPFETVLNPDAAKLLIRKRMEVADGLADDEMDVGDLSGSLHTAALQALQSLPDEVAEVFSRRGQVFAVPKVVADRMESLLQARFGYKTRLFWDTPLNMWRSLALYFRPAFYLNNFFGNTTFLKLQGGSLGSVLRQAVDPRYRRMVREFIGENLEAVETTGFFDHASTRATHFGKHQDKYGAQLVTAVKGSRPGRAGGWLRQKLQRFNQEIEDAFRRESYLTAAQRQLMQSNVKGVGRPLLKSYKNLENMMEHGGDPAKMSRWLEETNDVMNNYAALTPLERNVLRRFFVPFWPFYKHAAKTLLRMPFDHPIKAAVLAHLGDLSREFAVELVGDEVEPWLEGMYPMAEGTEGDMRVFAPQSMNPVSDIVSQGSVFKNVAEQLNPYWKVGIEQATGQNLFTGKPFTDPNVTSGFGRARQFEIDPGAGTIEHLETGPRPNPLAHFLGQFPLFDTATEVLSEGASYSADPFTAIPDPDNPDQPLYPNDYGLELFRFLGFPMYDTNPDEYAQKMEEDRMAALSTWLSRQGF